MHIGAGLRPAPTKVLGRSSAQGIEHHASTQVAEPLGQRRTLLTCPGGDPQVMGSLLCQDHAQDVLEWSTRLPLRKPCQELGDCPKERTGALLVRDVPTAGERDQLRLW